MALEDFLPTLAYVLQQSVDGVQAAYTFDNLPAALNALPCFVVMPANGTQEFGGANVALYNIKAVLYHSPANLPEAYNFSVKAVNKVRKAIARNIKLGGLVSYVHPSPDGFFELGAINSLYGDKAYIGVIFNLVVKETGDFLIEA